MKLDDAERERIAELATQYGLVKGNGEPNLSEMARAMLATVKSMPKGWKP